jgi:ligand-binding SRPBCC domain-containing protein
LQVHVLERSQWVPAPVAETFAFFSDAANLQAITPPWLHFRILTALPVEMREGATIEYMLRLHGLPVRWLTRITNWQPGSEFTDEQVRGPYARWVHRHTFRAERGGTRLGDRVEYALPFDPLSRPVVPFYVRPLVERIFDFRGEVIRRTFHHVSPW